MIYLRVIKENGMISTFPIGDCYDIVYVTAIDIMQKRASYDVMNFIADKGMESMSRHYLLSDNLIAPLDCEGVAFGDKVKEYQFLFSNDTRIFTPKDDFDSEDEMKAFWDTMRKIPRYD